MGARGVHFAIAPATADLLLAARDDAALMEIVEGIEEEWDRAHLAESDKAWDAMHRCLTDGHLHDDGGEYPLNHVVCGGRQLHRGDDYTVSLVTAAQVRDVATALAGIAEPWLRERYVTLLEPAGYDGEICDEDFAYTWEWFVRVRDFYQRAAQDGRAVIFTVDA